MQCLFTLTCCVIERIEEECQLFSVTHLHAIFEISLCATHQLKSRGDCRSGKKTTGYIQLETCIQDKIMHNSPTEVTRGLRRVGRKHWLFPVVHLHNILCATHPLKSRGKWDGVEKSMHHFQLHTCISDRTHMYLHNSHSEVKTELGGWEERHQSFPVTFQLSMHNVSICYICTQLTCWNSRGS